MLLDEGAYNDGILYTYWVKTDLNNLRIDKFELGVPIYYYYLGVFSYFSDVTFAYRVATLAGMLIIAFSSFTLLKNHTPLSQHQALAITLISSLWPFYTVAISIAILPYIICSALFYAGWLMYLEAKRWYWKMLACLLMAMSYFNNELMIYHCSFLLLYFLLEYRLKDLFSFIRKNPVLCLLPFAFYGIKIIFLQPYGTEKGYNDITFPGETPWLQIVNFVGFMVRSMKFELIPPLLGVALYSLIFFPVPILVAVYCYRHRERYESTVPRYKMILSGFFLLFFALLGYVLVGKTPLLLSYTARHGTIASLAAALFISGLFNLTKHKMITSLLIAGLVLTDMVFYLSWQARGAQNESFMQHMREIKPTDDISIFFLESGLNAGVDYINQTSDTTVLLNTAWGAEKWAVVPDFYNWLYHLSGRSAAELYVSKVAPTPDIARRNALSEFNPDGCWAELTVMPADQAYTKYWNFPLLGEVSTAIEYAYNRFFRPEHMHDFLNGLMNVTITPLHTNSKKTPC